jgi:hypothetical protein
MDQTLQYGVTRAQESEPVNSHMICEEINKNGFFCDSVASPHDPESAVYRACRMDAAVDSFQSANRMLSHVPPWKGGTFISGLRQSRARPTCMEHDEAA